jgi:hypothetical protein
MDDLKLSEAQHGERDLAFELCVEHTEALSAFADQLVLWHSRRRS